MSEEIRPYCPSQCPSLSHSVLLFPCPFCEVVGRIYICMLTVPPSMHVVTAWDTCAPDPLVYPGGRGGWGPLVFLRYLESFLFLFFFSKPQTRSCVPCIHWANQSWDLDYFRSNHLCLSCSFSIIRPSRHVDDHFLLFGGPTADYSETGQLSFIPILSSL